jgi:uncharacterized cupin superfamily protein
VKRFNLFDDAALAVDPEEPAGYGARFASLRGRIGAEKLAASLVLLEQGQAVCPYHYEAIEEEWLFVFSGTPTVRTPAGEQVVAAGDVVCFPRGPAGAHKIANAAAEPARVLIVAERSRVAASVYEDSDKVGIFSPDYRAIFRRDDERDYWDGEGAEPGAAG